MIIKRGYFLKGDGDSDGDGKVAKGGSNDSGDVDVSDSKRKFTCGGDFNDNDGGDDNVVLILMMAMVLLVVMV